MSLRRFIRESAFQIARHDVALFLEEHEDDLLTIFQEEMQRLDDELPEENLFIDIKMVPLGEAILLSALRAITRFLRDDVPEKTVTESATPIERLKQTSVTEVD